jgi:hypothetical protein
MSESVVEHTGMSLMTPLMTMTRNMEVLFRP